MVLEGVQTRMKKTVVLLMALILTVALAACGQKNNGGSNNGASASESASASASELSGSFLASGSTALQPLVDQVSKKFMDTNTGVSIQVQGGGSGTGLTQVSEGQSDIGNSDVFASEKLDAAKAAELVDHQVAVVGIAAVVNPAVTVDNLTKQQLVDIFTGKVTNWNEVGGNDQKIQIVNRPSSSGTRATFEKFAVGQKTEDLPGSIQEDASGTVKKLVSETAGAIGYLGLSYLDDTVKAVKYEGVDATADNVANGTYTVWAYEHMYTKGEPNEAVKAFIDYMLSDEVQNADVVELGYIPASKMQVSRDVDGNITKL
jgi:phosphate transport system substrate-binding protein